VLTGLTLYVIIHRIFSSHQPHSSLASSDAAVPVFVIAPFQLHWGLTLTLLTPTLTEEIYLKNTPTGIRTWNTKRTLKLSVYHGATAQLANPAINSGFAS